MVVVEGPELSQPPDEAGKVLGVPGVVDLGVLVQDAQQRFLKLFHVLLVPEEWTV